MKKRKESNANELIIGDWVQKIKVVEKLKSYSYLKFNSQGKCIFKDITVEKGSSVPSDTSSFEFSYEIVNDSLLLNLGNEEEPYIESHEIIHLSKNKLALQFKNNKEHYRRVRK